MTNEELIKQMVSELNMIADDYTSMGDVDHGIIVREVADYIQLTYLKG